jgi:hypothetical protein
MSSRVVLFALVVGCSSPSSGGSAIDAPDKQIDAASIDAPAMHVDDGTPTRQACTSQFGTALSQAFGRLDGFLVSIVPPMTGACNADTSHVHLQIRSNGEIYDVAVNVGDENGTEDVHTLTMDQGMPGGAWAEGWHVGGIVDYVALGVHSTGLTLETKAALSSEIEADLQTVNHISVFATGYGPDGVHLVHRDGSGHDGVIVSEPLSTPSHLRLFSFTNQSF